jgi:hypothetical protein
MAASSSAEPGVNLPVARRDRERSGQLFDERLDRYA